MCRTMKHSIIEHAPQTVTVVSLLIILAVGGWVMVLFRPRRWPLWSAAALFLVAIQVWHWLVPALVLPAESGMPALAVRHLAVVVLVGVTAAAIPWIRMRAGDAGAS